MILGNANWLVRIPQGIFHDDAVFGLAENNPNRGILVGQAHEIIEGSEVKLHLPPVFRLELGNLQLNGNKAFQSAVIKKEVNEVFLIAHLQPVLTAEEGEDAAHLPQEMLNFADQRPLKLALAVLFAKLEKIKGVLVFSPTSWFKK